MHWKTTYLNLQPMSQLVDNKQGSQNSPTGWLTHLPHGQNGCHFVDNSFRCIFFNGNIFKCIFLNENVRISIKISLKFVPKGPINNISALIQIMAWRRSGDKPLSEAMVFSLLMHICLTWPQWVNSSPPGQNGCHSGRGHLQMQFLEWKL